MKSAPAAGTPPTRTRPGSARAASRSRSSEPAPAAALASSTGKATTRAVPPRRQAGPSGATAPPPARPVEPRPDRRQEDREEGDRREHAYQGDQHAANADAAEERQRQRDQGAEADGHGGAAEDDRVAGGLHRPLHRRGVVQPG